LLLLLSLPLLSWRLVNVEFKMTVQSRCVMKDTVALKMDTVGNQLIIVLRIGVRSSLENVMINLLARVVRNGDTARGTCAAQVMDSVDRPMLTARMDVNHLLESVMVRRDRRTRPRRRTGHHPRLSKSRPGPVAKNGDPVMRVTAAPKQVIVVKQTTTARLAVKVILASASKRRRKHGVVS
jgi:hypothetical protein